VFWKVRWKRFGKIRFFTLDKVDELKTAFSIYMNCINLTRYRYAWTSSNTMRTPYSTFEIKQTTRKIWFVEVPNKSINMHGV